MRALAGALMMLISLAGWADNTPLPPSFSADYAIYKGVKVGEARRIFENRDGAFYYESDSKTTGIIGLFVKQNIIEKSYLAFVNGAVEPQRFTYRRTGRKDRTIIQDFDWSSNEVTSQVDGKVYTLPLPPGTVDQNMYQLRIMVDLKAGLRDMTYPMVVRDKIEDIVIHYVGNEQVDTPFGRLDTVVIRRNEKRSQTTLWCAPALQFLPVRIDHREDGDHYTANITAVKGLTVAPN